MSIFQVQLSQPQNLASGWVTDPAFVTYSITNSGATNATASGGSKQKSMEVTGPNLTRRRLYDGQVFTSTNYWKRYASTQQGGLVNSTYPLNDGTVPAFINVLYDDGSPYSDKDKAVNKFVRTWTAAVTSATIGTTGQVLDVYNTYGGYATYCQIRSVDNEVKVRLNTTASGTADLDIAPGTTQFFDNYDLPISYLSFYLPYGVSSANVDVLLTVEIISKD
jgi:hypothetical protein